jgi:hypothetical protein
MQGKVAALLSAEQTGQPAWILIVDILTGRPLGEIRAAEAFRNVAFSPDGRYVLATGARQAQIFDVLSGVALATWRHTGGEEIAGRQNLHLARFTDSGLAVTASDADGRVRIYDLDKRGSSPRVLTGDLAVLSPTGRYLAYRASPGTYRILDLSKNELVAGLPAPRSGSFIAPGSFADEGPSFAAPNDDPGVSVYDSVTGTVRGFRIETPARTVDFAPGGRTIGVITHGDVRRSTSAALYSLVTLKMQTDLSPYLRGDGLAEPMEFDETGRWLALTARPNTLASERIRLFDLADPKRPALKVTLNGRWAERQRDDNDRRLSRSGSTLFGSRERVPPHRRSVIPDSLLAIFDLKAEAKPSTFLSPTYSQPEDKDDDQYFRVLDLPEYDEARRMIFAGFAAAKGPERRYVLHDRAQGKNVAEFVETGSEILSVLFEENPKRVFLLVRQSSTGKTTLYSMPL